MPSGVETLQPLHCTPLPVRNIPFISNCHFFSCSLWLLPLGFPLPPSGKGMFCLITPLLQSWAADLFSACFPSASSGTFPQSCSLHLVLMNGFIGHKCKNVDLSSLNFMKCLPTIPAAWPASEQRLCSPKHQLQFPQVHVTCRHGEGAIPLPHQAV